MAAPSTTATQMVFRNGIGIECRLYHKNQKDPELLWALFRPVRCMLPFPKLSPPVIQIQMRQIQGSGREALVNFPGDAKPLRTDVMLTLYESASKLFCKYTFEMIQKTVVIKEPIYSLRNSYIHFIKVRMLKPLPDPNLPNYTPP